MGEILRRSKVCLILRLGFECLLPGGYTHSIHAFGAGSLLLVYGLAFVVTAHDPSCDYARNDTHRLNATACPSFPVSPARTA
jgi:hypothetical protein